MIDELDLALVDALRVDPRAPWSKLAGPLGVDPATLSRRWARLTADGDAWVTCYPSAERMGVGLTALVAVDCRADAVASVTATLAADPQTPTVEVVTGETDLMITVAALEPDQVTAYVLDRVGAVPGVLRTRTAFVERTLREGSRWREGALDPSQREAIGTGLAASPDPGPTRGGALRRALDDRTLMQALGADGRMPFAELATRTGLPATTVRRHVEELRRTGRLVLRCDASPRLNGHVVGTWLWVDIPARELDAATRWLVDLPAVRMCGVVAGAPANVVVNVMTHQAADARRIEAQLGVRFPSARVTGRQVILRTEKLVGHLLDREGRARGYVPLDPWQDAPADSASPYGR
ncbi:Lrp/AsnC family transcriptional regulator [Streptacidiphilus jiangxiensis]|uniref:DNA-binding transcriptional regulator, Lrp family n=1 Tax=Streptacidiphilus jiangxiensis TaxID=235985 RepID=A0A1H8BT15_STRJI|nr:Lrp/AsnC family transcriptional regulator [Streptacidiphilus jiangxiensis]SEM85027.1 DNA-binding transcriptional regulator, Lrp family [Streptacidiphilus jiangxiensis]